MLIVKDEQSIVIVSQIHYSSVGERETVLKSVFWIKLSDAEHKGRSCVHSQKCTTACFTIQDASVLQDSVLQNKKCRGYFLQYCKVSYF